MILVPQRYSPETLVRRLEESDTFGVPWSNWRYKVEGEVYEGKEPYTLSGPYREVARPTQPVKKPAVSYEGKYLRTLLAIVATSPENERSALKDGTAFGDLIVLLGYPSDPGHWRNSGRVVRYDFWKKGFIPQVFDLDLMSQEYARIFLRRRSEGWVEKGELPEKIKQRILRRDPE